VHSPFFSYGVFERVLCLYEFFVCARANMKFMMFFVGQEILREWLIRCVYSLLLFGFC
jgi:hypothetical protein